MQNIGIVQNLINDLVANVFQAVFIKQTQQKLPNFILRNVNRSLEEVNIYGVEKNNHESNKNFINSVIDHGGLKVDNFTPGECKHSYKIGQPPKLNQKSNSRYTKTLSMRSQNASSYRDLTTSRQELTKTDTKYRVKNSSKSFIKLHTQTKDEIQEFKEEEKLRQQLMTKRQLQSNANNIQLLTKRKISQKKNNNSRQLNDLKTFTFNYDFTILKSNQKQFSIKDEAFQGKAKNQSSSNNQSFKQISGLWSSITKPQTLSKKKRSINQSSMPQIISKQFSGRKDLNKSQKSKTYHSEVILNEQRSKSVIDMMSKQTKVQKGIKIKQVIDGIAEQLKKDSIQIERQFGEFSKKEFQNSFSRKKFISRIRKNINDC